MKTSSPIPLFPLTGTILLPEQPLPLNIFEPRYLAMTRYALEHDRIIGMVQPQGVYDGSQGGAGDLFTIGGAGEIAEHSETPDGRIEMMLVGVGSFEIERELPKQDGFRLANVSWAEHRTNQEPVESTSVGFQLKRLLDELGMRINWQEAQSMPGDELVDALAMAIPFSAPEKQALLECRGPKERLEMMATLGDYYMSNPSVSSATLQ